VAQAAQLMSFANMSHLAGFSQSKNHFAFGQILPLALGIVAVHVNSTVCKKSLLN